MHSNDIFASFSLSFFCVFVIECVKDDLGKHACTSEIYLCVNRQRSEMKGRESKKQSDILTTRNTSKERHKDKICRCVVKH